MASEILQNSLESLALSYKFLAFKKRQRLRLEDQGGDGRTRRNGPQAHGELLTCRQGGGSTLPPGALDNPTFKLSPSLLCRQDAATVCSCADLGAGS